MLPLSSPPLRLLLNLPGNVPVRPEPNSWNRQIFPFIVFFPGLSFFPPCFFFLMSHPPSHSSSFSSHVLKEINTEPKETNQRAAERGPAGPHLWSHSPGSHPRTQGRGRDGRMGRMQGCKVWLMERWNGWRPKGWSGMKGTWSRMRQRYKRRACGREMNEIRDEGKRGGAVGSRGARGSAYHGKFCSCDWSAEREPSYIMYIMDPWEIFIHIKWSSTTRCLDATVQLGIACGGHFNILFCLYFLC